MKVYMTRMIPKAAEILKDRCQVIIHKGPKPPSKREIIRSIKDAEALLCIPYDLIDEEIIESARKLRIISTYSVGYDHIDIKAASKHGIIVAYTPEVLTDATADLTFALILDVARRVTEGDRLIRARKWRKGWRYDFMLGTNIHGKTLGIIGMGRIGSAVAKRAKGFNMNVIYHNRHIVEGREGEYRSLEALLRESDFLSLHLPLTKETYHMINEERLRMMKPTAFLINTARGSIVEEKALIKALKRGWIAGAALDVFEEEPLLDKRLLKFDNVVLTPHIGSASTETRERMAEVAALNILNLFEGKEPLYSLAKVAEIAKEPE